MTHFLETYGLVFLFLVVALESTGLWVPGETTLIAAAILASQGHLDIRAVIAVAALAAILGDNAGYWIGRAGGRALLNRWGPVRRVADRVLPPAERFFERHGPKTVFIARFVIGLRVTAAWMAGISRMNPWRFLGWNAAGGIAWAVGVGLLYYELGEAAAAAIARYGLIAGAVIALLVVLGAAGFHVWNRRLVRAD